MHIKDTNKIIWIDLATNVVDVKDVPKELIQLYLGGRGVNSWLLNQYCSPETDPLSPENPLIVGTGMLTGLKGLTFSRTVITAKSPESGLFGDANIGGGFGVNLKKNGYSYSATLHKVATDGFSMLEMQMVGVLLLPGNDVYPDLKKIYSDQELKDVEKIYKMMSEN